MSTRTKSPPPSIICFSSSQVILGISGRVKPCSASSSAEGGVDGVIASVVGGIVVVGGAVVSVVGNGAVFGVAGGSGVAVGAAAGAQDATTRATKTREMQTTIHLVRGSVNTSITPSNNLNRQADGLGRAHPLYSCTEVL